jgi:hypothetical protein
MWRWVSDVEFAMLQGSQRPAFGSCRSLHTLHVQLPTCGAEVLISNGETVIALFAYRRVERVSNECGCFYLLRS